MSRPFGNHDSFPTADIEADVTRELAMLVAYASDARQEFDNDFPALASEQLRTLVRRGARALAKLEELEARRKEQAEVRGEAVAL